MRDLCLKGWPVLEAYILAENQAQLNKWGIQDQAPFAWLAYATEELGELSKAISEWQYRGAAPGKVAVEAIQLATLAIKIAEMFTAQAELQAAGCRDLAGVKVNCNTCAAFAGGGCEGKR